MSGIITKGIMACENDKCEKYGMHHDYQNGVEVRKCEFCINDQPEDSEREDPVIEMAKITGNAMRLWEDNVIRECGALSTMETS